MSLINLSVKHGRTQDDARGCLEKTVGEVCSKFGAMVHRVEWTGDRNAVKVSGTGFEANLRVDAQDVHAVVDVPFLSGLLGETLSNSLKVIMQQNFKCLPR